jgi:hypothetical protein
MTPTPPTAATSPADRVSYAYHDRANSDYYFKDLGVVILLMIVTCGVYSYIVFYQLMRRMRDHNRRRLAMLEAANEAAWAEANRQGVADELRPNFERVGTHLAVLRNMSQDFRDPVVWLLLGIVTGIAIVVAYILLDQDLIKHDKNEGAVEAELTAIFDRLGRPLPQPDPARVKGQHNYVGRVFALVGSCGIYSYWWYRDLMVEGNRHFEQNWPWEDALAGTVPQMTAAA